MKFLNSFQDFLKYSLLIALFSILSYASPFGNKLIVPIVELDKDPKHYAYVPAFDLKVGESGEIVRWFTKEHSTIVARAAVVEIKDARAKIAFEPFEGLEQGAFPAPILFPKKGDEVIFRSFNDRAFLVAPSQEIYEKIQAAYPDVTWLHPDLLAAYLMDVGHTSPVKGDFRKVCTQYAAGIVYLVNLNEGQALDCQTFIAIKKDYITGRAPVDERMLPFFSRIGIDNQNWFTYLINNVTTRDYYLYFDALLKGDISDEDATFFGRVTKYFTNQIKIFSKGAR
ncbi:plasminogen-binding N-terminal domain-containing protein [Helicobacter sp.]|uniref:plasminogen-binding N-terminal domain-containing protein n=1 Tax=Helicobacter sp. TaxID=218 RepID=UPI0025B84BE8|nr:plasminogen-binding N-terminal domain-containing protein [Helicobacter sp.]MCI5969373.1 plasminogen-binding N-terminal domain-containing protein [Helicobacter sp.]MDY2585627.1 plasminogen-binding N-terminal domain-containing protein [Helicobacter sp.]